MIMKNKIIISTLIVASAIGGALFFSNNLSNKNEEVVKSMKITDITNTIDDELYNKPAVVTESVPVVNEVISTPTESTITTTPVIPAARSFDELMSFYDFKSRSDTLDRFIRIRHDEKPEKFTPENIEDTFKRLDASFPVTGYDPVMYYTFTW